MTPANRSQRGFDLRRLPMPADAYRPDFFLRPDLDPRTGKPRSGFETIEQSKAEDATRALALRATARTLVSSSDGAAPVPENSELKRLNLDPQAASNLANRLAAGAAAGCPQPTLASRPSKTNARC
jgi:hypothetical protein